MNRRVRSIPSSAARIALAASLCALAHGQSASAPAALFREVGAQALPGVSTECGSREKNWIIEVNGGGVALGDFDGDGDADLVVVDGSTLERVQKGEPGNPPRLFLNESRAGEGIRFAPAGPEWAMSGGRWGMGCATGDINEDGWLDLIVTQWGPVRVFLNRAGKGFEEQQKSGLPAGERWGTSAALFDYDEDGHLDLAVINYLAFDPASVQSRTSAHCRWKDIAVMCGPQGLPPIHDQLFRGKGDGSFTDDSVRAGFRPNGAAYGLGCMITDYDLDGHVDLFVSNDSTPNFLWHNTGKGGFEEKANALGVAVDSAGKEQASMGIGCADVDGDRKPEIFVTTFSGETNSYFKSGARVYREHSSRVGLGGPSMAQLAWGTAIIDYDLDGDLDIHVFNGHVYPQADEKGTDTSYAQQDQLFRNVGSTPANPRFAEEPLSDAGPLVSRASAQADLDGDGDVDIVALQIEGPVRVLENRANSAAEHGHWLRVQLRRASGNRQAIGARLVLEAGGITRSAEIRTTGGFQAAVPAEAHFGLGASAKVDKLEIHWPGGKLQQLGDLAVDRVLVVEEQP